MMKIKWPFGGNKEKRLITPDQLVNPGGQPVTIINGRFLPYVDDKITYIEKGYTMNDLVYGAVKLIVDKAILAPWAPYEVVDEAEYAKMQIFAKQLHIPGALQAFKECKRKALKPAKNDEALIERLKYPNEENTLSKHHAALFTYKLITGDYFELWSLAPGGLNKGKPISLDYLPPQYMSITASNTIPARVLSYSLDNFSITPFTKEQILHEYYFNPHWDINGEQLFGLSPLEAMRRRMQRNNENQEASARSAQNGGTIGVGYLDDPRLRMEDQTQAQANALRDSMNKYKKNGVLKSRTTVVSGYKVGWSQWGLSPVDLDIMESEKWDMRMIYGAYGVPSQLGNDPDNKSFNSLVEAEKALTSRCALPLLNDREQSLTRKLHSLPAYKNSRIVISYDMTVYRELEEDKAKQADWLNKAYWIKGRRKQEMMGEEVDMNEPLLDKYIIPSGLMLMEDLNAAPDPDNEDDFEDQKDYQ